jgi:hypothetical protein
MATREEVLAAYAANPKAELVPDQDSINFWMNNDLSQFNSVVDAVRAANPALATKIDTSRAAAPVAGLLTPTPVTAPPPAAVVDTTAAPATVTDYQGRTYDSATILNLAKQITASIDPNAVKGGVFSTSGESVGFNFDEATRLLGRAPTASEQVVLDMARHLSKEGVTDLNQVDATETNRRFGSTFTGGGGTIYEIKKDADGKPIISTWSKDTSDKKTILTGLALAALAFGIPGVSEGLLGAAPAGATIGTTALTAAEAAGLTATDLAIGGGALAGTPFTAAQLAGFTAGTAGTGLLGGTAGAALTPAEIATLTAQDLAIGGGGLAGYAPLTAAEIAGLTAADLAIGGTAGGAGLLPSSVAAGGAGLLSSGGAASTVGGATTAGGAATTLGGATIPASITTPLVKAGVSTAVNSLLGGGTNLSNLFSGGLGTAGNLLQMQQSREAALAAQKIIDAETAAAKASAAFRPIGMTTRFGTSQFQVDPVTGRLTGAGYTLSPEAKAQQDRFMALSNAGLTQAEGAQAQFAPLQTGAQRLFGLGNQYLAQSPESVAQNYLNQQMALLQPGRELELANLQNRLQQQGRGGLAVAQGGTMGATTPELQALYNARAQQEAQLAANAQQYGQQNVAFGAGLLGTGAQTMGQYYAGQQAAYAPYTTAMGQVQGLEALGQQPFTLGSQLGQTASTAGARAGQLGLEGARLSTALATSADATRNLGAQSLIAAGNPNAQFGQSISGLLGGLFGSGAPVNALSSAAYGPGNAGFQNMLNDIYG